MRRSRHCYLLSFPGTFQGKVDKITSDSSMTHCWHLLVLHINTDSYRTAGARLDVRSIPPVDAQTDENSHCSVNFTVLFMVERKTILITYWIGRKEVISIVRSSWCRCPGNLIFVLLSSSNYLGVAMFSSGESNSEITARSILKSSSIWRTGE
jgi:hypothetical protein